MTLFPGVVVTLEALRARGVPLGMAPTGRQPSAAQDRAARSRALLRRDRRGRRDGRGQARRGRLPLRPLQARGEGGGRLDGGDNLEWDVLAPQRWPAGIWVDAAGPGAAEVLLVAPHRVSAPFRSCSNSLGGKFRCQHCDSTWVFDWRTHQCATGPSCRCSWASSCPPTGCRATHREWEVWRAHPTHYATRITCLLDEEHGGRAPRSAPS